MSLTDDPTMSEDKAVWAAAGTTLLTALDVQTCWPALHWTWTARGSALEGWMCNDDGEPRVSAIRIETLPSDWRDANGNTLVEINLVWGLQTLPTPRTPRGVRRIADQIKSMGEAAWAVPSGVPEATQQRIRNAVFGSSGGAA